MLTYNRLEMSLLSYSLMGVSNSKNQIIPYCMKDEYV